MTYEPDPNGDRFRARREAEEIAYTGWLVGGMMAFAIVFGLFIAFGSTTDPMRTAANTEPTTTGSATSDVPKGPITTGAIVRDSLPPSQFVPEKPADNIVPPGQSRP